MPFITRSFSTFGTTDICSDMIADSGLLSSSNLPAQSRLNKWVHKLDHRRDSFDSNYSSSSSSSCGSPPAATPLENYRQHRQLHNYTPKDDSCYGGPAKTCSSTLAELFEGEWDPKFAEYLRKHHQRSPKPTRRRRIIPENQLPTGSNNYSVSNYTIEMIISLGLKHGHQYAELAIQDLLQHVPACERQSHKTKLLQRAQLLTKKRAQLPLCAFCRNNGEPAYIYTNHTLRDSFGMVTCPVLRAYTCPRCGAHGDNAHTLTYCPLNRSTPTTTAVSCAQTSTLLNLMTRLRM